MQDAKEILINYVKDNQEKLYRIAFSYSKNEEAALDIVQEAITKALKNMNKLREEQYVKSWFYRILINESLDYVKKNKKILTCELEENVPKQYQLVDNNIIKSILDDVILELMKKQDMLRQDGLRRFGIQGNLIEGRVEPWEIFRAERWLSKDVDMER